MPFTLQGWLFGIMWGEEDRAQSRATWSEDALNMACELHIGYWTIHDNWKNVLWIVFLTTRALSFTSQTYIFIFECVYHCEGGREGWVMEIIASYSQLGASLCVQRKSKIGTSKVGN